ncbi:ATPase [Paenibacillus sp. TAF43_2]|uniref:ATPase n=1 Tax=Paenibacillus sp. TAF43_2 TaxID=3233069 RepID=UPI003F9C8019
MPKVVQFKQLELVNYTGLRSQSVHYGRVTNLSGRNGEGKSSIGGAPVWILWGKDLLGADYTSAKNSPRPSNYKYDRVFASILLSVDGIEYKFAREIAGKTNSFYVNDIPRSAKEYDAAVASLFSQEEFMALYYPAFFFGLHWTKQRALLMQGVTPPLNKTVFEGMDKLQSGKLAELTKKHTINDLEAKHKELKPKLDKAHTEAVGATKKMREMLGRLPETQADITTLEADAATLKLDIEREEKIVYDASSINTHYNALESRWQQLDKQVKDSAAAWPALKEEPILITCRTCKQLLQDEAVDAVTADKEKRVEQYRIKHADLQAKRKEAHEALKQAERVDIEEQQTKVRALKEQYESLLGNIRDHNERARLAAEVATAKETEAAALISQRDTTFILDAIKAFRAKEAELQAAEIQSKFTTLSIRLYKYVASRNEYDPDFSVQKDGKDYTSLSAGEKIGAGLELTEVLFKQSGLITPVFIDGIGEYTGPVAAYDQVITGRTVPEIDLKIEVDGVIV